MRTVRARSRVACLVGAMVLLFPFAPAMAASGDDHNRPVDVTFTKWGVTAPPLPAPQPPFGLFEGFSGDSPLGSFVAEVLWRQLSLNGHVNGLEALYESRGRRPFVQRAHPGRVEFGGRGLSRRRHSGRVARRRAGTGRVPEVSRDCRNAELRGGTRQQDVLRGDDSRRSCPTRLSTPRAQRVGRFMWRPGCLRRNLARQN